MRSWHLAAMAAVLLLCAWSWHSAPMVECAWCKRTDRLNRCHILPQESHPEAANLPENIVILCRDCHLVLQHRCS